MVACEEYHLGTVHPIMISLPTMAYTDKIWPNNPNTKWHIGWIFQFYLGANSMEIEMVLPGYLTNNLCH